MRQGRRRKVLNNKMEKEKGSAKQGDGKEKGSAKGEGEC